MSKDKLAQLKDENYISLETFKKSGQGVATPVWFAEADGKLYLYTLADAGKVKRIRNNPKVKIATCTMRGSVTGEWIDAKASILDSAESKRVDKLLTRKYGLLKRMGDFFRKFSKKERAYISIQVE